MLSNLQAEMKRSGVSNADIQSLLSCSPKTVTNKLKASTALSIWDAIKIRDTFFPSMDLEYLFAKEPQAAKFYHKSATRQNSARTEPGPQSEAGIRDSA